MLRDMFWRITPYRLKLWRLERVWNGTIETEPWGQDG